MMYRYLIVILCLFVWMQIKAQWRGKTSVEAGENYISSGFYTKSYAELSYFVDDWELQALAGATFINPMENSFDALKISANKNLKIKEFPLKVGWFFQWRPFSERLNEHNAAMIFQHHYKRMDYHLGVNSRFFSLRKSYADENNYAKRTIWEAWNIMYKLTYNQPISEKWKSSISITNFDMLLQLQETNPFLVADIDYNFTKNAHLFVDLGYLQAGLLNIRVNYFGYFVRGGIQWKF